MKNVLFLLLALVLYSCEIDNIEFVGYVTGKSIQSEVTYDGYIDVTDFTISTKKYDTIYVSKGLYNMIEVGENLFLNSNQFSLDDENNIDVSL